MDGSTIIRVRQVANDGALAALTASKPGSPGKSAWAWSWEEIHVEIKRLGGVVKEPAVKLTLLKKGSRT